MAAEVEERRGVMRDVSLRNPGHRDAHQPAREGAGQIGREAWRDDKVVRPRQIARTPPARPEDCLYVPGGDPGGLGGEEEALHCRLLWKENRLSTRQERPWCAGAGADDLKVSLGQLEPHQA